MLFLSKINFRLVSIIGGFLLLPTLASAQFFSPVVPCDKDCGFASLITLAQNLIDFALIIIVPISMIFFAYAGWLYMSSFGDEGKVKQAKKIFYNLAVGVVIMAMAWLVIYALTETLLSDYFKGNRLL